MSNRSGGPGRRWLRYLVYAAAAAAFLVWGAGSWVVTEPGGGVHGDDPGPDGGRCDGSALTTPVAVAMAAPSPTPRGGRAQTTRATSRAGSPPSARRRRLSGPRSGTGAARSQTLCRPLPQRSPPPSLPLTRRWCRCATRSTRCSRHRPPLNSPGARARLPAIPRTVGLRDKGRYQARPEPSTYGSRERLRRLFRVGSRHAATCQRRAPGHGDAGPARLVRDLDHAIAGPRLQVGRPGTVVAGGEMIPQARVQVPPHCGSLAGDRRPAAVGDRGQTCIWRRCCGVPGP